VLGSVAAQTGSLGHVNSAVHVQRSTTVIVGASGETEGRERDKKRDHPRDCFGCRRLTTALPTGGGGIGRILKGAALRLGPRQKNESCRRCFLSMNPGATAFARLIASRTHLRGQDFVKSDDCWPWRPGVVWACSGDISGSSPHDGVDAHDAPLGGGRALIMPAAKERPWTFDYTEGQRFGVEHRVPISSSWRQ